MIPLYKNSHSYALRFDDINAWRDSFRENIRCREFLDEEINRNFDGYNLSEKCVENCVEKFGYDRTMWVIANTILERKGDGRFHRENTEWAKRFNIPRSDRNYEFSLRCHSCPVDGAADSIREMYAKLNLFSGKHTVQSDESQDYTGKLLILRDTVLKEEFRTPENRLFLAESGFGCSPTASGRKVYGQFLSDGEKTQFYRQDFIGVIADEHIPDWAREKLEQLTAEQEQTQNNSPEMKM